MWGCEPLGDVDTELWISPTLINALAETRECIPRLFQCLICDLLLKSESFLLRMDVENQFLPPWEMRMTGSGGRPTA